MLLKMSDVADVNLVMLFVVKTIISLEDRKIFPATLYNNLMLLYHTILKTMSKQKSNTKTCNK